MAVQALDLSIALHEVIVVRHQEARQAHHGQSQCGHISQVLREGSAKVHLCRLTVPLGCLQLDTCEPLILLFIILDPARGYCGKLGLYNLLREARGEKIVSEDILTL